MINKKICKKCEKPLRPALKAGTEDPLEYDYWCNCNSEDIKIVHNKHLQTPKFGSKNFPK